MNKKLARYFLAAVLTATATATLVGLLFTINAVGKALTPKVVYQEQENADCYTAGKMFFVSIACVLKP